MRITYILAFNNFVGYFNKFLWDLILHNSINNTLRNNRNILKIFYYIQNWLYSCSCKVFYLSSNCIIQHFTRTTVEPILDIIKYFQNIPIIPQSIVYPIEL